MMERRGLLEIHTDGASRGNPGEAAYAFTIQGQGMTTIEEAGLLGNLTNNKAEYKALIKALERALSLGTHHSLMIYSDSELMVKQMSGEYRVKNAELIDLYSDAKDIVNQFQGAVRFHHIPREKNKRTDELCNQVLDQKMSKGSSKTTRNHLADEALEALVIPILEDACALPSAQEVFQKIVKTLHKKGFHIQKK